MDSANNQKERITNINYVISSAALIGSISGVIYSHKTGGGFFRGLGYWVLGGLIIGSLGSLIALPFKNKILKEGE